MQKRDRRAYMKQYNANRREEQRLRAAAYRAAYPDRVANTRAKYRAATLARRAAYRAAHPNVVRGIKARYRAQNKAQILAYTNLRRARKLQQAPRMSGLERTVIRAFYATARRFREITGESYHVDHIIPLALGGLHHPSNLQVLRGAENLKKGIS